VKKVFCDKCDAECSGSVGTMALAIYHRTRQGEYLGEDEFAPADLCLDCANIVVASVKLDARPRLAKESLCEAAEPAENISGTILSSHP
jgi:hypothetical protein